MTSPRISLGKKGEELAGKHLMRLGYRIVERNYRVCFGEIDLIAEDGGVLVFIEVKTRKSKSHGQPFEALTRFKCRQISKVALEYIGRFGREGHPARFDVVSVTFNERQEAEIEVVRNAFDLCYGT